MRAAEAITYVLETCLELIQLFVVDEHRLIVYVFLNESMTVFFVDFADDCLDRGIALDEHA